MWWSQEHIGDYNHNTRATLCRGGMKNGYSVMHVWRGSERDERPGKNLGAFESLLPDHSSSLTHLCISVLGPIAKLYIFLFSVFYYSIAL